MTFCNQSFQRMLPDACPLYSHYYAADMSLSNISFNQDSATNDDISDCIIIDEFCNGIDDNFNNEMCEESYSISDNSYQRLLNTDGELSSNIDSNEICDDLTELDTDDEYFNIPTDDEDEFLTNPDVFSEINHYLAEFNDDEFSELDCIQV